jgi:DNA-directed RNA polymerase subunit RPC12/RpoP
MSTQPKRPTLSALPLKSWVSPTHRVEKRVGISAEGMPFYLIKCVVCGTETHHSEAALRSVNNDNPLRCHRCDPILLTKEIN